MSIVNEMPKRSDESQILERSAETIHGEYTENVSHIEQVLQQLERKIAPVWPLSDYVAVNPYMGFANKKFLAARRKLRSLSDLETLMSVDYYREQFTAGTIHRVDIDAAVDELVADGVTGAERIDINQVVALLNEQSDPSPTSDAKFEKASSFARPLRALSEILEQYTSSDWSRLILDEISKHCAAHYDEGQAIWPSSWKELPLYEAWRLAAQHDRSFEILGVAGFRKIVAGLPDQPHVALDAMLNYLGVPTEIRSDLLLCEALKMPGWSAWTRYQQQEAERSGETNTDFAGLLAIRLAYEVALSEQLNFRVDWTSVRQHYFLHAEHTAEDTDEDLLRYALLKASEIAFRRRLVKCLMKPQDDVRRNEPTTRKLAQLVFCIDVRSERFRRHLEATSGEVATYGFAGFFGLPIKFTQLGQAEGSSQVPALISPQFEVHEEFETDSAANVDSVLDRRANVRFLRKAWKEFQCSAVSCFAFVETTGLFYGFKLISRLIGRGQSVPSRFDGVEKGERSLLSPTLRGLNQQGVTTSMQADLAESILRGIGIVDDFARLVVLCGHGSQTENNPLQAGLDCGACGGHSGESNARLAAKILNQMYIRQALSERGIEIPEDTQFVAALHNTTTDEIEFFDTHDLPSTHHGDLQELQTATAAATRRTRKERLELLPGSDTKDLVRRGRDWSEVRPEWGLAGNAAFIAAPRDITKSFSLKGRSFLHSYDYRNDPESAVLEQIMTAPMVVANWINMQYYASMVDPTHFGSGNKAVHNVVGRFGVFSGNGGDLMTGLPWQSLHDGKQYQHHPLRLLVVLAAPRDAIEAVIAKHENVADLLTNGWLQLVAIEDGNCYRYTEQQSWEELTTLGQAASCLLIRFFLRTI